MSNLCRSSVEHRLRVHLSPPTGHPCQLSANHAWTLGLQPFSEIYAPAKNNSYCHTPLHQVTENGYDPMAVSTGDCSKEHCLGHLGKTCETNACSTKQMRHFKASTILPSALSGGLDSRLSSARCGDVDIDPSIPNSPFLTSVANFLARVPTPNIGGKGMMCNNQCSVVSGIRKYQRIRTRTQ